MPKKMTWQEYYDAIQGRSPRQHLVNALELFKAPVLQAPQLAIDLGCGDGTESIYLLENGWHVLAIDGEPAAIKHLLAKTPEDLAINLQTQVVRFEALTFPDADLIHASYSLPFCPPEHFSTLWQKIIASVKRNGRFAGQLFGVNDSWSDSTKMTFHTKQEALALFETFEIEYFAERDEDGQAASGPKHWHDFTIIAKKI